MASYKIAVVFAACVVLSTARPPPTSHSVMADSPAEVLFKNDNYSTALLPCAIDTLEKNVKYTWHKNGAPFDWESAGHILQRPGEGSIMFFNPQASDEAVYQCFAETSAGTASTGPISLKKTFLNLPTVETKTHKPVLGKPYKLECLIPESYPKPTIEWKTQLRSDPNIIDTILDRRITLSPDGTLWFSNITESDISPSFKYICLAKTPAYNEEKVLAEHFLESLVENPGANDGELVPQYVSNDMVGKVGTVTMIYCIYGGTPLGFPDWFKDGKLIEAKPGDRVTDHNRTSGKRLLIKETLLEDEGTYSCEVNNGVGKKQSHSMKLSVVSAPILVQKLEKQLNVKEASEVEVPCKVTGVPEPKITWTLNGKPLDSQNYKDGVLPIAKVKKTDSGYYGCKAENEHGVIYAETLVNVA